MDSLIFDDYDATIEKKLREFQMIEKHSKKIY